MLIYSSNEEAQAAADQLSKLMQLTHWSVKVKIDTFDDKRFGNVAYSINKRLATIRLLDPAAFQPDSAITYELDHERTLIHELAHLYLAPLDPLIETNPLSEQIIENAVESISIMVQSLLDVGRRRVQEQDSETV
jgi:hypothetical protein